MTQMLSPADLLRALPLEQREAELAKLSTEAKAALLYHWPFWARPDQIDPEGVWRTWLILAGRGWGKSRTGAELVRKWAKADPGCRIALVGLTAADCRDVMVEGESGILSVHAPDERPLYEPSKRRLTWPNGSIATCYNASEPDQLRGPQHHYAWVDELAKFPDAQELWDQLTFGLRLGEHPQSVVTTTPRPMPIIRRMVAEFTSQDQLPLAERTIIVTRGRTLDNAQNLAPGAVAAMMERYDGTRLGRQELDGEIVDEVVGALWTREMLDRARAREVPQMARVVVAIDPSGTRGDDDGGDEIGIVVAGRGIDGRGYVLADRTCSLSPDGWARLATTAYHEFKADRLVAERNFGGAMVEAVIRNSDRSVAYKEVTASRGKAVRAEPISALYEQGRISHVHGLEALEDEMVLMTPSGFMGDGSPNRVDALVWALTEAMLSHVPSKPDVQLGQRGPRNPMMAPGGWMR